MNNEIILKIYFIMTKFTPSFLRCLLISAVTLLECNWSSYIIKSGRPWVDECGWGRNFLVRIRQTKGL